MFAKIVKRGVEGKTNTPSPLELKFAHQQSEIDSVKKNNNLTLIIGFSNCGKTYLMKFILLQKQEPVLIITKSPNQNPNIRAQISDEIRTLENYENSTFLKICCYKNKHAIMISFS